MSEPTKTMDFTTEWWSKLMVVLMIVIAVIINPVLPSAEWTFGSTLGYLFNILGFPLIAIAIATIPVLIICWVIKLLPDLDYSIWLAFIYMLYLLIRHFV